MLQVFFVFVADVLQQLVVPIKLHRRQRDRPWFGVGLRIIDSKLKLEVQIRLAAFQNRRNVGFAIRCPRCGRGQVRLAISGARDPFGGRIQPLTRCGKGCDRQDVAASEPVLRFIVASKVGLLAHRFLS